MRYNLFTCDHNVTSHVMTQGGGIWRYSLNPLTLFPLTQQEKIGVVRFGSVTEIRFGSVR